MIFKNRIEAGLLLADKLKKYQTDASLVLAIPRGGVPVAYAVAKELGQPIELILTKKIGHPTNKEYAIGAASLTDYFSIPHISVTEEYIQTEVARIRNRMKEMYKIYMGDQDPADLEGKTVIIIDDGIATGNTLLGTIQLLRKSKPGKIMIAVPVASKSAIKMLAEEVDEIIVVYIPDQFYGVGAFYEDFEQVGDEEVIYYLEKMRELKKTG